MRYFLRAIRMKIFITADLHFRQHWFRWLIEQGASYNLICIAGDLLDMFGKEPRIAQAREVSRWIRELAKVTRVAICSGNHDDAGRQISADRAPVYEWFFALGKERNIITDGVTQTVNDLIVTTVPYHCSKQQKSVWLDRGSTFRRQLGSSWLVLHHAPPMGFPGSVGEEREAAELFQRYRPAYFISGHSHQFPYLAGRSWTHLIKGVDLLVPGQLLAAPFPNHIILDTNSGQARWETSSKEWIPEDLFSKFPPV
jgi:predicted MPP superfamily phosphohydrolase